MRNAFAEELTELAAADERIVMLSGDIGNRLFDTYKSRFADRFLNCGVAEANMMGMAAGMAMSGMRPIVYTIVPFVTTRCLEQIRVDVCYHNVPVVIVGVGGGLSYAGLGATHHSCEDIAFLRMLPEMTVVCPADRHETRAALHAAVRTDGPVYLRLGKKDEADVHPRTPDFEIGKSLTLQTGDDVALVGTGNILPVVQAAARCLDQQGVSVRVVSMHTVKPLDEELLRDVFATCRVVATVEEHSRLGGLGGAVAEWLSEQTRQPARLLRFGTDDVFLHEAGSQEFARNRFGLESEQIAQRVLEFDRSTSREK